MTLLDPDRQTGASPDAAENENGDGVVDRHTGPGTVNDDPDLWRDYALCRDTNPDLFFPIGTTGVALDSIAHAKAVCKQCVVTEDCLNFALDTHQDSGVWGGLSEAERRTIRRQRTAAKRAARARASEN